MKSACSSISVRYFIDSKVGANYYHLFRLPMSIEELIKKKGEKSIKLSEKEAINLLSNIANNLSVNNNSGPKNIGSIDNLDNDIIQVFAAEYLNAFNNDYTVHPYLN